jgi:hypothetical protein
MKKEISHTKNGRLVYVDDESSHAATHLADTPTLLALVQEFITELSVEDDNIYLDKDMGRVVGTSDLVETTDQDEIVYARRPNRQTYTRFALHRTAEPTQMVTIVLQKDSDGNYELWSAWIGIAAPQFPGDEKETPESKPFWNRHALVWGNQAVQPGTETTACPWG